MTQSQYKGLCKIFEKELTEKDLKEMGFSPVDGIFDEDVDYDIGLYKFEEFKDKCRRKQQ